MPQTLERAHKLGLRSIAFWPSCPAVLTSILGIQKLLYLKIPTVLLRCPLVECMYIHNIGPLFWNCFQDPNVGDLLFKTVLVKIKRIVNEHAEYVLCNSFQGIQLQLVPESIPKILSVGPLISKNQLPKQVGSFWPEDSNYATWLDEQPPKSVIYAAFGSLAVMPEHQFEELALGLELTNRRFLLVVRSDFTENSIDAYPDGFLNRVRDSGRIVRWTDQQKVLAHPSVSCFVSHCGWNSTMEGVRNGIRFLCWPYFADQFVNESYVCDEWRIGLRLVADGGGVVSREEIAIKVEKLLVDEEFEKRAVKMKMMAQKSVDMGGESFQNLHEFAEAIRTQIV